VSLAERLTPKQPKVLVYDIETSPHLTYTYDLYGADIRPDMIVEPSRLLCWAGKWMDAKGVMFYSEHHNDRAEMVEAMWHALDEADIVIGYNHRGFDNKHVMREFVTSGLGPPSPWQDVDLLKENRRLFKFASNRLGYVTEVLGLETKLDTGGQGLWRKVLEGDEAAWAKFKRYNIQDVRVTQLLAEYLWPYLGLPHMGLWADDLTCCPTCGGSDLTPMGKAYTRTMSYPRMICACGAYCKVLASGQTRPL
jgi:DNA polymerase elongation subunit (family B)